MGDSEIFSQANISESIYNGLIQCFGRTGMSPHQVIMSIESFRKLQAECTRHGLTKSVSGDEFKNRIYGVEIEFDENLGDVILIY